MERELIIKNDSQELIRVAAFIEEIGDEIGIDMDLQMNLQLVLEEIVSNVIFYAYPKGTTAIISLSAGFDGKVLTLILSDEGRAFDPTKKKDVDIIANPMDREQGGLGIFIVKNIMDTVDYQRTKGKNILTMTKIIPSTIKIQKNNSMTKIIKENGKTIIQTGERIDTLNAAQFERDIEPALEPGVDLEIDCSQLVYVASSGLRIIQATMRTVIRELGGKIKMTHVSEGIYKILYMTGFTRHLTIERTEK